MNKKIVGIFICMLLILTVSTTVGTYQKQVIETENTMILNESIELVDQHNPYDADPGTDIALDIADEAFAQSFIPEHSPLTKIRLNGWVYGSPTPNTDYTVSIREMLDGEDIISSIVNSDDFIVGNIDFIFPDTNLIIGKIYYIIIIADKPTTPHNWYLWRSSLDTYYNGELWVYANGQWQTVEEYSGRGLDLGFKTYWRDYAPDNPDIDGPIDANTGEYIDYTFHTIDSEGHDVRYYIEWGDGNTSEWFVEYESGEYAEKSHKWESEGDYTIRAKAKDVYDAESDWSTFDVSITKSKSYLPFGFIFVFGFDVDVKIVQLEPGEDYVDLEVLSKPFYIWENQIQTRNPGEFIRLYNAKGLFSPSLPFCFGICNDWGIIG
jgi:hypothetical protein